MCIAKGGDNGVVGVLQWGSSHIATSYMNPEQLIAIILQKSAVGAGDALQASKALGEGDMVGTKAHLYRAARLALADTDAGLTAVERVILLTTIDETKPCHIGGHTSSIRICFSEAEYAALVTRAEEQGMTDSAYVRWAAVYAGLDAGEPEQNQST